MENNTPIPVIQLHEEFKVRIWFSRFEWENPAYRTRLRVSSLPFTVEEEAKGFTVEVTVNLTKVAYLLGMLKTD
jgi:hypothetical protein